MNNISDDNTPSSLTVEELKTLEKKSRYIIYGYKVQLTNVLRYNSGGTIITKNIEKQLRSILKDLRNNNENKQRFEVGLDDKRILKGIKQPKGRKFFVGESEYNPITTSGDTYRHIRTQGIELFERGKISMKHQDIDEYQHINDIIRNEWHDLSEYITDDIPGFEKSNKFRKWENDVEHEIISKEDSLTDKEKGHLIKILDYGKNSRFKLYEYLLCIEDAIDMMQNNDKYNETLSVIYEILKFNIPKLLGEIVLDNGEQKKIVDFSGTRSYIREHQTQIDQLFIYLKNNKDRLFEEYRFKTNNYDRGDVQENFDKFKKDWNDLKELNRLAEGYGFYNNENSFYFD